jgi:hypothetical protein
MDEQLCIHERWIVEVEPDEWAHEDDMLSCVPADQIPVVYVDEVA